MVGGRGRWFVLAAATLAVLAGAETAAAGTNTLRDGNDRPGRLDIRAASQGHAGSRVTHTIRTFGRWPTSLLGPSTPNYLLLVLSTDSDPAPERLVLIVSSRGRLLAGVFNPRGRLLGRAGASRPNRRSARVFIRRSLLGNPAGYRWQAFAFFRGTGTCSGGCRDRAPNRSRVLHDLRAPTISFPQPGVPADTTYGIGFSVSDVGGSGIRSWRLETRDLGTAIWQIVGSTGSGSGAQVRQHASAEDEDEQFRVVAVDRHGNRTTSPVRTVSVPVDDGSFTYGGGMWTTGGSPVDFLGTLHLSPGPGATATYAFNGAHVALVMPGGSGMADVRIDGSLVGTVDLAGFTGPRRIVFQTTFGSAAARTLELTVLSGTIPVDGIIVR
jgi:hypothetical protein